MRSELWFVDTNVLLYCLDWNNPEKQRTCAAWVDRLWIGGGACLSWQVLNELYSVATRKLGRSAQDVRGRLRMYCAWKPLGYSLELLERAWYWSDRAGIDHWDALILAGAEQLGCRYLLTEDFQHGREYGSIRVVDPFETDPADFFAPAN